MERIRGRMGWIAIGLGAAALVVALATSGWFGGVASARGGRFDAQQPQQSQQQPQQSQQQPQQGQDGRRGQQQPQQGQRHAEGASRDGRAMGSHDAGFFGLGGWLRMGWQALRNGAGIALALVLVLLGAQFLRRNDRGPRRDGGDGGSSADAPTERPSPDSPATGETQNLS